jgi:predicted PurR-regulated permease PerM
MHARLLFPSGQRANRVASHGVWYRSPGVETAGRWCNVTADDRLTHNLKIVGLTLGCICLLVAAGIVLERVLPVVIVLIGATFFAYLVYPPINWLQKRRWPRWLAIAAVYVVLLIIVGGIFAFIGPRIAFEMRALGRDFPGLLMQTRGAIVGANNNLLDAVPLEARVTAVNVIDQLVTQLQTAAGAFAGQALSIALSVASVITGLIIIPVLAAYILLDLDRLRNMSIQFVTERRRQVVLDVLADVDSVLSGFIRGQIIVGSIIAVIVTVMLLLLHVKYALLIGIFAGVTDIIPYVGAIAGAIPAVLIALFTNGPLSMLVVATGFLAMYEIEGHFIAPAIVGQRVGLTPLLVIVSILVGAELGGVLGMFVAVPIAGTLRVLAKRFLGRPDAIAAKDAGLVTVAVVEERPAVM